jgi:hypothetical protein
MKQKTPLAVAIAAALSLLAQPAVSGADPSSGYVASDDVLIVARKDSDEDQGKKLGLDKENQGQGKKLGHDDEARAAAKADREADREEDDDDEGEDEDDDKGKKEKGEKAKGKKDKGDYE